MKKCDRDVMNEQGFRILKVTKEELEIATDQECCFCDSCMKTPEYGYYVAVLNCWLCPQCFNRWLNNAIRYPEDTEVEERNYQRYRALLGWY